MTVWPESMDSSWEGVRLFTFLVLYLPVLFVVYTVAENRQENGFFWAVLSLIIPIVIPIIYFTWVLISKLSNRKSTRKKGNEYEAPATQYSRQRIRGGSGLTGRKNDYIEDLISDGDLDAAETRVKDMLAEAEEHADFATITDMMAYIDRLKKLRK